MKMKRLNKSNTNIAKLRVFPKMPKIQVSAIAVVFRCKEVNLKPVRVISNNL